MSGHAHFRLSSDAIDVAMERTAVLGHAGAGAFASFEGWVRNTHLGRAVRSLRYEANDVLALRTGRQLLVQLVSTHGLLAAAAVHRTGTLVIGEVAVWVGVCAPHRDAAFAACREAIDQIKSQVPIWKLEHYIDNEKTWVSADLVNKL